MTLRILVVDDASFVRDTLKRNLRNMLPEIDISEAADGRKAVAVLKKSQVDIIFSDWEMPEMSGHELLSWVRAQPALAKTPFIMVTSRGDRENVINAVQAGVSDYMTKPFTPEELRKKLAKQLKIIGYKPKGRGIAGGQSSSTDILTGGSRAQVQKPREIRDASDFAKPVSQTEPPSRPGSFNGEASLRFAGNSTASQCKVRDLSLQALSGVIAREESLPALFTHAVVDLATPEGEAIARINGYVHSLQAAETTPEARLIRIQIRFVDDDPAKYEQLSKLISG